MFVLFVVVSCLWSTHTDGTYRNVRQDNGESRLKVRSLLRRAQASPVRLSYKGNIGLKTLVWSESSGLRQGPLRDFDFLNLW